jgi:dephospho-CoA kinase
MFLIGLTGGIASGKSTVASMLQSKGAEVIDADQVAREVVSIGSPGLAAVVERFGEVVLAADGSLSRTALADLIFGDERARLTLEQILHPLIASRTSELILRSQSEIIVYSVPLLVEANVQHPFDLVVTVEAGVESQLKRMVSERNLTKEQARLRLNAQATELQRVESSDVRLENSGTLEALANQVDQLWQVIALKAKEKGSGGKN